MKMSNKKSQYDEIKGMLNVLRKMNSTTNGTLREQVEMSTQQPQQQMAQSGGQENEDFTVINGVDIQVHSEDSQDLAINDNEKGLISKLIDDFKAEVSELVEFGKLNIYTDSAKLDGKISGRNIEFTLSTGDDNGVYLSNASMLKIDDETMETLQKLKTFEDKFAGSINDLIVNRKDN
jgi:hypothetical protein